MKRSGLSTSVLLATLLASPPTSSGQDMETHEVSLDELLFMPERYGGMLRLSGVLDVIPSRRGHVYSLRGAYGLRLLLCAERGATQDWEHQAPRFVGREVTVTGVFSQGYPPEAERGAPPVSTDADTGLAPFYLLVRTFMGPPDEKAVPRRRAEVALEDLGADPEAFLGRELTLTGQFRGYNLFADLPTASRPGAHDWVLKDGPWAIWVTGKKPEGDGWRLDPTSRSDSARWVLVKGRVRRSGDVVVIRATSVALVSGR